MTKQKWLNNFRHKGSLKKSKQYIQELFEDERQQEIMHEEADKEQKKKPLKVIKLQDLIKINRNKIEN